MARLWARVPLALFALTLRVCPAQTTVPDHLPELRYPPIARIAHVQGDVVVSFRQTPEGSTADVKPISGPPMLQGVAVENIKAWRFPATSKLAEQFREVTFHFQLNLPEDGYDHDGQPVTKVELDGAGGVQVLAISTTGLERSK